MIAVVLVLVVVAGLVGVAIGEMLVPRPSLMNRNSSAFTKKDNLRFMNGNYSSFMKRNRSAFVNMKNSTFVNGNNSRFRGGNYSLFINRKCSTSMNWHHHHRTSMNWHHRRHSIACWTLTVRVHTSQSSDYDARTFNGTHTFFLTTNDDSSNSPCSSMRHNISEISELLELISRGVEGVRIVLASPREGLPCTCPVRIDKWTNTESS